MSQDSSGPGRYGGQQQQPSGSQQQFPGFPSQAAAFSAAFPGMFQQPFVPQPTQSFITAPQRPPAAQSFNTPPFSLPKPPQLDLGGGSNQMFSAHSSASTSSPFSMTQQQMASLLGSSQFQFPSIGGFSQPQATAAHQGGLADLLSPSGLLSSFSAPTQAPVHSSTSVNSSSMDPSGLLSSFMSSTPAPSHQQHQPSTSRGSNARAAEAAAQFLLNSTHQSAASANLLSSFMNTADLGGSLSAFGGSSGGGGGAPFEQPPSQGSLFSSLFNSSSFGGVSGLMDTPSSSSQQLPMEPIAKAPPPVIDVTSPTFATPQQLPSPKKRTSTGAMSDDAGGHQHHMDDLMNLEGLDIFADLSKKEQEALMSSTMDIDTSIFDEDHGDHHHPSTSKDHDHHAPEPMDLTAPVPVEKPKEVEVVPETPQSKLEKLLGSMRKSASALPRPVPGPSPHGLMVGTPPAFAAPAPVPEAVASGSGNKGVLSFTPPHASDPLDDAMMDYNAPTPAMLGGRPHPFSIAALAKHSPLKKAREASERKSSATPPVFAAPIAPKDRKIVPKAPIVPIWRRGTLPEPEKKESTNDFAFTDDEDDEFAMRMEEQDIVVDDDDHVGGGAGGGGEGHGESGGGGGGLGEVAVPKYIPGVGFEIPEAVDKGAAAKMGPRKRYPPLHVFNDEDPVAHAARHETLAFRAMLRKRIADRHDGDFAYSVDADDNECFREKTKTELDDIEKPPLPRLVIKIPRKIEKEEDDDVPVYKKRGRKKKQSGSDSDEEWRGSTEARKRKKGRVGRPPKTPLDQRWSSRLVDPTNKKEETVEASTSSATSDYYNKKKRYMKQWQDEREAASNGFTYGRKELKSLSLIVNEFKSAADRARLAKFRPAIGHVERNSFLVLKADLCRSDCALWRVDSPSLLQKFPPKKIRFARIPGEDETEKIVYGSSQTYSGWCREVAGQYLIVDINFVSRNRTFAEVEPIFPLLDLIPAVTEECMEVFVGTEPEPVLAKYDLPRQNDCKAAIMKDPLSTSLYVFVCNMLEGVDAGDYFIEHAKTVDFARSRALVDIDGAVNGAIETTRRRLGWSEANASYLSRYSSAHAVDVEGTNTATCQGCSTAPVKRIVQLYRRAGYDPITMRPLPKEDCHPSPPIKNGDGTAEDGDFFVEDDDDSLSLDFGGDVVSDSEEAEKQPNGTGEVKEEADPESEAKAEPNDANLDVETMSNKSEVICLPDMLDQPAVEFLVCSSCSEAALAHHRALHLRNEMVERMERRLAEVILAAPSLTPAQIVDQVRTGFVWMQAFTDDIMAFWRGLSGQTEAVGIEEEPPVADAENIAVA